MKREIIALLTPSLWCLYIVLKFIFTKKFESTKGDSMSEDQSNVKVGIKETKELLDGLNTIAEEIISVAKDGIQVQDAVQIVEDLILKPEFKAKLVSAVQNVKDIPAEIKDLDLAEGVELVQFEYEGVKRIIEALKK